MTRDEASRLISRYHDALNAHARHADGFYSEDAVVVSPIFRYLTGRPAIRESFGNLFRLAPDYHVQPTLRCSSLRVPGPPTSTPSAVEYSEHLLGLARRTSH